MRARDVLAFFAELREDGDLRRSLALAERLSLDTKRRVAFMSTGMRQKLALAVTLAAKAELLVLDEPTANLDPNVRSEVIALVNEAQADGHTIMFSSHILSEVEEACDRVAIVRTGQLVHTQMMAELHRQHRIRARLTGPLPPVPDDVNGELSVYHTEGDQLTIEAPGELSSILGWLSSLPLDEVTIEHHLACVPSTIATTSMRVRRSLLTCRDIGKPWPPEMREQLPMSRALRKNPFVMPGSAGGVRFRPVRVLLGPRCAIKSARNGAISKHPREPSRLLATALLRCRSQLFTYEGRIPVSYEEPIVYLMMAVWAITRGSDSVSGAIERAPWK